MRLVGADIPLWNQWLAGQTGYGRRHKITRLRERLLHVSEASQLREFSFLPVSLPSPLPWKPTPAREAQEA